MPARRRAVLLLLVVCYGLLALAWVVGNPPGAAPDESDHYMRALAVAHGDVRGRPNPALDGQPESLPKSVGGPALAGLWLKKGARVVSVPAGLAPTGFACNAFVSEKNSMCLEDANPAPGPTQALTTIGTVEPGLYLLPGLAARLGHHPQSAMRLARAANATVAVALLAAAAALLWTSSRSSLVLVGLVVAVTPQVLFVAASVSPSSAEIAAGICFFAAVMSIGRGDGSALAWVAAGVAGVVLAASRSLGPIWILLDVAIVVAAHGWKVCWRSVWGGGAAAAVAIGAITVAAASTALWEASIQPGVDFSGSYFFDQLPPTFADLPGVGHDLIGHFGWLDTRMPGLAYLAWTAMVVVLVALALLVGTRRQRIVLCVVPAVATVLTVLISAGLLRQNGFSIQGRHVLAFVVVVPLLAGDILAANAGRLGQLQPRRLLLWFTVPAAAVHAVGWYANARRNAVGTHGQLFFLGHSKWSPPGGWEPWAVVVALAAVAAATGAWLAQGRVEPPADVDAGSGPGRQYASGS